MAANMQHMAGAGQTMPQQQMRRQGNQQLQHVVYEQLVQHPPTANAGTWQSGTPINERLSKTMTLITNILLAIQAMDHTRALEYSCNFEREAFFNSPTKEAYDQTMSNKTLEFFKKRQANEPILQNALNANTQQIQAQQNMLNMQAQMGRGINQGVGHGMGAQQGFQQLQHPMQNSQITQQQQQQQQQTQPQQSQQQLQQQTPQQQQSQQSQQQQQQQLAQQQMMAMGIGVGMGNQNGRGMGPNQQQQMMNMMGGQNRPNQAMPSEIARLANSDKGKVAEVANKLMAQASEQAKAAARHQMQSKLPAQQLAEFQAQGKDPVVLFYQHQAFNMLKNNMKNMNQLQNQNLNGQQNQNAMQAAMMQAQQSQQPVQQQPMQQRQNMMNGIPQNAQQNAFGTESAQFAPNLDSIKDQQINGFIAQQAGQIVVPASNAGPRNATPQTMNQNMQGQQGVSQGGRPKQAQQQPQQHQSGNTQQSTMNQTAQQTQAQLQAQMRQIQAQQPGTAAGVGQTQQSPAMNALNTPVSRPQSTMNNVGAQGLGQGNSGFGDQRFNQGIQRPNNSAFNSMLANMTHEQRNAMSGMPPDKLHEVLRRWQSSRQEQMGMNNAGQITPGQLTPGQITPGQAQNRSQAQHGQMPVGMGGMGQQGMQQASGPAINNQQQVQASRGPGQNAQTQVMMDSMDLPPQVMNQLGSLPQEVKKWRDLKAWVAANNQTLQPNVQRQLSGLQQRQFALLMNRRQQPQAAQNPNPNNGIPMSGSSMPQQQQQQQQQQAGMQQAGMQQAGMQRLNGNYPAHLNTASPQEMVHMRAQRPQFANMTDEQLRSTVIQVKKVNWAQQQERARQGAQPQPGFPGNMNQPGQIQMPVTPGVLQMMQQQQQPQQSPPLPNPMARMQPQAANVMSQTASMQRQASSAKKQAVPASEQPARNKRQKASNAAAQAPTPSPAQPAKNLKRPSTDDAADTASKMKPAGPARPAAQAQAQAQMQTGVKTLTPQQIEKMPPDQRAKYEQILKMQVAAKGPQAVSQNQNPNQATSDSLARLKEIGQQEQKAFSKEVMQDLPMSPQELAETTMKLQRIVIDMSKIGRGLAKWYAITRDDERAAKYFRTRMRIMRQFADGEQTKTPKATLSLRIQELDDSRRMFESMAKDLAASVHGRNMRKFPGQAPAAQGVQQQGTQQSMPQQNQQRQPSTASQVPLPMMPQNQQAMPAPLNAANLEKNSEAFDKMNQPKAASKAAQAAAAAAPAAQQQSFHLPGSSPHGNPSYIGKAKDMTLQLPPARKRPKVSHQPTGQTPQSSVASPQIKKTASPEVARAAEPQPPPKPVLVCKYPECQSSTTGYANEQVLQQHVADEHVRPMEDPVKYVQEALAKALGLEDDGSPKKEQKPAETAPAPAMSATTSKQGGLTPGNLVGTPMSQGGVMKRSGSSMSKQQEKLTAKTSGTSKLGDVKPTITVAAPAEQDPWVNATIDTTALFFYLGYEPGMPGIINDMQAFRSLSSQDTPDSIKDSGASEPNTDVSEGAALDIALNWQNMGNMDNDLLMHMDDTNLEGGKESPSALDGRGTTLDPALLMNTYVPPTDWNDIHTDFSRPFTLDTKFYHMQTS